VLNVAVGVLAPTTGVLATNGGCSVNVTTALTHAIVLVILAMGSPRETGTPNDGAPQRASGTLAECLPECTWFVIAKHDGDHVTGRWLSRVVLSAREKG
jgi:hypothetical protein